MTGKGSIQFYNVSEFDASIFKVDGKKNETHVIDLVPQASQKEETFSGEMWIVRDKETGQQMGSVTGTASPQRYEIKILRSRGAPRSSGSTG